MNVHIRQFEERDYGRVGEIAAAAEPERGRDADWFRQRDLAMDSRIRNARLVAEVDARVVGWGDLFNTWWMYHPRKFQLRLNVDPEFQGQGLGSGLYARLMQNDWDPLRIGCEVRETRPHSVAFLEHRGFAEVARRWQAVLQLADASLEQLPAALGAVDAQGIRIVNMVEVRRQKGDAAFTRELFDLEQLIYRDEPGYDPESTLQFEQFVNNELNPSVFFEEASYLALDGERMVGVSRIERDGAAPHRLHVGFTGTHPDYRGRGIAVALKLRTIDDARTHGTEMSTTNDSTNAAMLHINEAIGFQRQPAWIVLEKRFSTA